MDEKYFFANIWGDTEEREWRGYLGDTERDWGDTERD
jgi:hypothetical protein